MKYDAKVIGKRIREARIAAGFKSQKELAEKLYLSLDSRTSVSAWENGKRIPTLEYLMQMCKIFQCELGYLLCEHNCKTKEATDIQGVTGLSEKSINLLNAINNRQTILNGEQGVVYIGNKALSSSLINFILNSLFEDEHFWSGFDGLLSSYVKAKDNDKGKEVHPSEINAISSSRYALSQHFEKLIDAILASYESKSKPKKLF